MKTLDLKRGIQGEFIGSASLVNEVVNDDGFDPSLHLDFNEVGQVAFMQGADGPQYQRTMQLLDAVCARASGATNIEWDFTNGGVVGQLTEMEPNTVRWNSVAGLFHEGERTNSIRNVRAEAAVAGTPGTLPTHWALSGLGTVTASVIGSGYQSGCPYLDIRLSGTPSGSITLLFESSTQVSAATGQSWTVSSGVKLQGGSLTNLSGVSLDLVERTGAGGFVATASGSIATPTFSHRRIFSSAVLSGGGTVAAVQPGIRFAYAGSGAIDITLRIYAPQLELGATPTSPILPPIGEPGASTRAAETVTSLATVTRASRKSNAGEWNFLNGGAVGAYREFLPNQPAITGKGLLAEEATTNQIRNPRGEGAVPGSPGTFPTHWVRFNATGGNSAVHSVETRKDWPGIVIDFSGTAGWTLRTEVTTQIAAASGQNWTASVCFEAVAPIINAQFRLVIDERDGSGNLLSSQNSAFFDVPNKLSRMFFSTTLTESSAAFITLSIQCLQSGNPSGRIFIAAPQLEQKAYPTSPILPPKGTLAAATRAADDVTILNGPWSNNGAPGSSLVEFAMNGAPGLTCVILDYGVSGSNRFSVLHQHPQLKYGVFAFGASGSSNVSILAADTVYNQSVTAATAWADNDVAMSVSGEPQDVNTNTLIGYGAANFYIGRRADNGSRTPSIYISRIRYAKHRAPNAELETLVGN